MLAGTGLGAFTLPPPPLPSVLTLTSAPNGGNNPWVTAGGYQYGGVAVFGWVDGSGNVECGTYDETSGSIGGPYTIHAAFQADAHSSPAFLRRSSDGKIVCVYSHHNATPLNRRISTNADDPTAWGSATDLDAQLGGARYTDYQMVELSDGTIVLFYRDEPSAGTDSRWCYSTSTDGGVTWAAQIQLFKIASTRSYAIMWKPSGSDLLHFATTNGASSGFTKIGHFRMNGLTLARTKSDGTAIAAALPLTFADITTVYTGAGNVFPITLAFDSANPVIAGWDTLTYTYHRWNGSAWTNTSIVSAGTGFEYNGTGTGFQPWGISVDDGVPDDVWLLKDAGGFPSVYRYHTGDGGATFTPTLVSSTAGKVHTVVAIRNPDVMRAYFPVGTWSTYTSWSAGLTGILG